MVLTIRPSKVASCCLVSAIFCVPAWVFAVQPKVSAGGQHTVYLKADGSLYTWGSNYSGQLGSGPPVDPVTPKQIGIGYIAATAGGGHTAAIRSDGTLWAWGAGGGVLGDGTTIGTWTPKLIGNGFSSVAAGSAHNLALKTDGSLWAWGTNFSGQLGDGSRTQSLVPKQIGTGFSSVSTCNAQSFAKKSDGTYWAWGQGPFVDGTANSLVPKSMGTGYTVMTCNFAIKTDGTLWGWGSNWAGQLGDGTTIDSSSPKLIGSGFTDVAPNGTSTLAIKADGTLWSWGSFLGTTMLEQEQFSLTPRQIGTGFIQLSSANGYAVALKMDNTVWGWGSNGWGQVGNGLPSNAYVPKSISGTSGGSTAFTVVAAGQNHSVAIKADGTLWAWGLNRFGQLCCSNTGRSNIPKFIGAGYVTAAAGSDHTLAIKSDGTLWAWGWNSSGQVGDGTTTDVLLPKLIGNGYSQVASASVTSYAIKADGSLWGWGFNPDGRLGNGTTSNSEVPALIGTGFTKVVAGAAHAAALKSDGSLWTWGWNASGQLGDGSPTGNVSVLSPRQIGSGYVDVAAGQMNTAAIKTDGTLWTWGSAPLGDGSTTDANVPKLIGAGFASVTVGNGVFVAVKRDGTLWSWGIGGAFGTLGQGFSVLGSSTTPVQIGDGFSRVAASAIGAHVLAIKQDASVWVWGEGSKGQLGDGNSDPLQPVQISIPQTVVVTPISCVFDWAERTYPTIFPNTGFISGLLIDFSYRYYPISGNYLYQTLGSDHLGVYGPASSNTLMDLGPVSNWATVAGCN